MARLSLLRYRRSKHLLSAVALLFLPALLMGVTALFQLFMSDFAMATPLVMDRQPFFREPKTLSLATGLETYRLVYQNGFIYFSIFFLAMIFGQAAIREETEEQTLHYLLLQPIPRTAILGGKLLGFMAMAIPLLLVSVCLCQFLALLPYGWEGMREAFTQHGRAGALAAEVAVAALAMMAWCTLFMALGTLIKMPFAMFMVYGWEFGSSFLPVLLQQFTISYYVRSLLPSRSLREAGAIQVLAEPAGIVTSLVVVLVTITVALGATMLLVWRRECVYSEA